MAQNPIPIVDFAKVGGGDKRKEEVAREIDMAFREVGFVYLRNHGVDAEMVREAFEWVRSPNIHHVRTFPNPLI